MRVIRGYAYIFHVLAGDWLDLVLCCRRNSSKVYAVVLKMTLSWSVYRRLSSGPSSHTTLLVEGALCQRVWSMTQRTSKTSWAHTGKRSSYVSIKINLWSLYRRLTFLTCMWLLVNTPQFGTHTLWLQLTSHINRPWHNLRAEILFSGFFFVFLFFVPYSR